MGKKMRALEDIERGLSELKAQQAAAPVDFDLLLSTAEKTVVIAGVGALVIIAGTLVRLTWLTTHPDDPAWHDAWEGGGSSGRDAMSYSSNRPAVDDNA